jgi:hypothetical protein
MRAFYRKRAFMFLPRRIERTKIVLPSFADDFGTMFTFNRFNHFLLFNNRKSSPAELAASLTADAIQ